MTEEEREAVDEICRALADLQMQRAEPAASDRAHTVASFLPDLSVDGRSSPNSELGFEKR